MSNIRKHSIYGTIYSYVGVILGFVVNLLIYPNVFSTEEVGLFTLLVAYAGIMASFAGLGFNMVGIKIFPIFRDKETKNHGFLGLVLLINILGFILVSAFFYFFNSWIIDPDDLKNIFFLEYADYIYLILLFYVLFLVFDLYYRVLYNSSIGILYKDIIQRLLIIISFLLYYFEILSFSETVLAYVLANVLPAILLMFSLMKDGKFHLSFNFKFLDRKKINEIIHLNIHGVLLSFASVIALRLDAIMIHQMKDLSSVGIYFVTFNVATLILIPYRTMGKVGSIVISDAYKAKDYTLIEQISSKSSITLFLLGTILLLGIWGNVDTIFFLLKKEYKVGMYVILLIGIANLIETSIGISSQLLFYAGKHKDLTLIMYVYLGLLFILNLIFIPIYGIIGAAIATMSAKIIATFLKWITIKKQLKVQPIGYNHLIILSLGLSIYFISQWIQLGNPWLNFIIRSGFMVLTFFIPLYFLKISQDMNDWVEKIIQKLFNK